MSISPKKKSLYIVFELGEESITLKLVTKSLDKVKLFENSLYYLVYKYPYRGINILLSPKSGVRLRNFVDKMLETLNIKDIEKWEPQAGFSKSLLKV